MICATGQGSAIAANKISGIRAAACSETFSARYSRLHNDANLLCLGARVVGEGLALEVVQAWLDASFTGEERHRRRLAKIASLEAEG
jgi:ribose 5-phosphate isomerase B